MAKKTDADLALADKIDLARTLLRFKSRRQVVRELNDVEDEIKALHDAQVAAGKLTSIDLEAISVKPMGELPRGE